MEQQAREKKEWKINFGIVPRSSSTRVCINIQKVLYKSKFDALSIRTRRIALKRSLTNIPLGESSPKFLLLSASLTPRNFFGFASIEMKIFN